MLDAPAAPTADEDLASRGKPRPDVYDHPIPIDLMGALIKALNKSA